MKYVSLVFVTGFLFVSLTGFSEKRNPDLAASRIPEALKKGADAVMRFSETTQKILSDRKVVYHRRYAVTVLNNEGKPFGYFMELYDKKSKISHISGTVYDAHGNLAKKVPGSGMQDFSAVSSGTLYQDDRIKVYTPRATSYPYTVVYEYDMEYDGMVYYPEWKPQPRYRFAVEKAWFKLLVNVNNKPRFKCRNIGEPETMAEDGMVAYKWSVSNLPAVRDEPMSGPITDRVPVVYLAPGTFTFEKTRGDLTTWAGVGRWISDLNRGRQELPEETVQKISDLVAGIDSRREKVKAVYQFMQDKTRYVSVQLGIGGFQPYPASFVDEKGFGDCKALSNYTLALLQAAGVDANYTLVKGESNGGQIMTDFPSNQFNHVILCVPDEKDTIWLECTSQQQPFNFLGSFTSDRDVLMITGDSGVLVHTPKYACDQNIQYRHAVVRLDENGDATAEIFTKYGGLQIENAQAALLLKGEELKKHYYDGLDLPDLTIKKIQLKEVLTEGLPEIDERLEVSLQKYMSQGGKRVFLPLNLMNKTTHIPKQLDERQSEMVLTYPYTDADTIIYHLPETLAVEYAPTDVVLETEFGTYQSLVKVEGRRITYIRRVTMKKGRYPKEMFAQFAALRKKIVKADKSKVLLKQTQLANKSAP